MRKGGREKGTCEVGSGRTADGKKAFEAEDMVGKSWGKQVKRYRGSRAAHAGPGCLECWVCCKKV